MKMKETRNSTGIFAWYGEGSYFRPHWQELLRQRGFSDIDLDPRFKARNLNKLLQLSRNWDTERSRTVLMTIGEIPLSIDGFRSLPEASSVVFMTDDEWRFHSVGRYLALYFDLVVTNTPVRVKDYEALGVNNVIHAPYAANTSVFHPQNASKKYEVVMIGAAHPDRLELVRHLVSENLPIRVFGSGWNRHPDLARVWGGFLSTDEMLSVLATAKIVINSGLTIGGLPQIKGRIFETAACRTFQITQQIPGLEIYYEPGTEIETYASLDDLAGKIRTYLDDDQLRESIANAGYERTVKEHTWESRLNSILVVAKTVPPTEFQPEIPRVVVIQPDVDVRNEIENAVNSDPGALITFGQGTGANDQDRIKLLAYGLTADMEENVWMNLASFDVVDKKRGIIANANIKTIAEQSSELLPPRSIMLSARKCLELLPDGEITQTTLINKVVPQLIQKLEYRHIDLDTGLFEEHASGKYSLSEIYRRSDQGLWDVRTKPYAVETLARLAFLDIFKLGLGILRRRKARRSAADRK
jgi:hypothetical protein